MLQGFLSNWHSLKTDIKWYIIHSIKWTNHICMQSYNWVGHFNKHFMCIFLQCNYIKPISCKYVKLHDFVNDVAKNWCMNYEVWFNDGFELIETSMVHQLLYQHPLPPPLNCIDYIISRQTIFSCQHAEPPPLKWPTIPTVGHSPAGNPSVKPWNFKT